MNVNGMDQTEIVVYEDEITAEQTSMRRVTMDEAVHFLDTKKRDAATIANAVSMCVLSPVLLILVGAMTEEARFRISEKFAAIIGLVFLFGMIAAAVYLFITCGIRENKLEVFEKENFETEHGVSELIREKSDSFDPLFAKGLALGVVCCILSVVPLVIAGVMDAPDYLLGVFVVVLLGMIAVGVNMIIRAGMTKSSFDMLLQEGEYSRSEKRAKKKMEALSSIYWSLMTVIYLGWSFWTMRWDFTWIVWPIAGVLFGVISAIIKLAIRSED